MENKNIAKISSMIITSTIVLAGLVLCFWLYTKVISIPSVSTNTSSFSKIKINQEKLSEIQNPTRKERVSPPEDFGRSNPFVPYK